MTRIGVSATPRKSAELKFHLGTRFSDRAQNRLLTSESREQNVMKRSWSQLTPLGAVIARQIVGMKGIKGLIPMEEGFVLVADDVTSLLEAFPRVIAVIRGQIRKPDTYVENLPADGQSTPALWLQPHVDKLPK